MKTDLVFFELDIIGKMLLHKIALDLNDSIAKYDDTLKHLALMFLGVVPITDLKCPPGYEPVEAIQLSFYIDDVPDEPEHLKDEVGRSHSMVNMVLLKNEDTKSILITVEITSIGIVIDVAVGCKWDSRKQSDVVRYTIDVWANHNPVDSDALIHDPLYKFTVENVRKSSADILERALIGHWTDSN